MKDILIFKENRVRRLYLGGSGIDALRGKKSVDGYEPEDWIGSCVEGNTREFQYPGHGLSKVAMPDGTEAYFRDLLKLYGKELLGARHLAEFGSSPGVLVKLLDSAIRLPLQVHPTTEDAQTYFKATNGKTEAWIILSCHAGAYVYLGFNDKLDINVFKQESLSGVYEKSLDMLHKIMVKPGDVIIVYGGMPHAIGENITMVEVMEPSDLTINPEALCGKKKIAPEKRFGGLEPEKALELFDYSIYTQPQIRQRCLPSGHEIFPDVWQLINRDEVGYFGAEEYFLNGHGVLPETDSFQIGVVAAGDCEIRGRSLKAGDGFFVPYKFGKCDMTGNGKLILIQPPVKRPGKRIYTHKREKIYA